MTMHVIYTSPMFYTTKATLIHVPQGALPMFKWRKECKYAVANVGSSKRYQSYATLSSILARAIVLFSILFSPLDYNQSGKPGNHFAKGEQL